MEIRLFKSIYKDKRCQEDSQNNDLQQSAKRIALVDIFTII